jgi:RNA polymerase sigma-54 factor
VGLGPSLSIRQTQQLVLTPQLTQAIKLLQLSNLELESFIAEELAKNPLLEAPADDEVEQPARDFDGEESDGEDAADDPGADDLILGQADDDRPLDHDWTADALETDSFADVATSAPSEDAFDFDRVQYSAASLAEHLLDQLHGASGDEGDLARIIAEMLEETGFLTMPLTEIAEATGAPLPTVERALALVQSLDPAGVGARSLA